jgi:hypothetical protein
MFDSILEFEKNVLELKTKGKKELGLNPHMENLTNI